MNKLLALADRVEKLTGPDREVDAEIAAAQGLRAVDEGHPLGWQCYDVDGRITAFRRYTASIDHAMTLVPENSITSLANEQRWKKPAWSWGINDKHGVTHFGSAATAALALVAAALRARAHGGGEG